MEFSLFGHMEQAGSRPEAARLPDRVLYEEFIQLCKMADAGGMRAIWTGEHHGMDFTIAPNPFISLTDIAHHTKTIRLGTGTIIAPFWHPIKLAGEAAMTDVITGGRLELGIARGAYSYEYERLKPGLDPWEAGQRMRELVPTLAGLWAGNYAHHGTYYDFPATTSCPKPLQADGPPLWIAARDPASHEFAVNQGCHVQVTPLWQGVDEIRSLMERFQKAVQERAIPRKTSAKIMLLHHCYIAEDDADLEEAVADIHAFYCYFGAWFKNDRSVHDGSIETLTPSEIQANKMVTKRGIRADLTLGKAQDIIDRLKLYEDLGYDEFAYWVDSGMSFERKRASLDRFIDQVMPHF